MTNLKPYYETQLGKFYHSHILDVLTELSDESVQSVVTSPPYWGLRDYGIPHQIWDERRKGYCRQFINHRETFVKSGHVWGDEIVYKRKKQIDN